MATFFGTAHRLETTLRVDPRLIVAARVMELAAVELDAAIDAEVAENPALERLERTESYESAPTTFEAGDREAQRSRPNDDVQPDATDRVVAPFHEREAVRARLRSNLPEHLYALGNYLVELLDNRGYLRESDEEIALATMSTLEDVAETIEALRLCEPAGIGARNVTDALVLMLHREGTAAASLAAEMLTDCLEDLLARRTKRLAKRFKVTEAEVEAGYAALLEQDPSPFGDEGLPSSPPAVPDLALVRSESGWSVEITGPGATEVFPSRTYVRHRRRLATDPHAPLEEKRHVEAYLDRAERFVTALESRRDTLRRLGEALIRQQSGFVTTGDVRFLRQMTRAGLASEIGVHESTLSRATANKFVRIGNGEIVPFSVFFTPSLRIQGMIEEIVAMENPSSPLSDERIREMLAAKGVHVARRTVNKYRARGRNLSSRGRKDAIS